MIYVITLTVEVTAPHANEAINTVKAALLNAGLPRVHVIDAEIIDTRAENEQ